MIDTGWVSAHGGTWWSRDVGRIQMRAYTRRVWRGGWRWEVSIPGPIGMALADCGNMLTDLLPTADDAKATAEAWVRDYARGLLSAVGE